MMDFASSSGHHHHRTASDTASGASSSNKPGKLYELYSSFILTFVKQIAAGSNGLLSKEPFLMESPKRPKKVVVCHIITKH